MTNHETIRWKAPEAPDLMAQAWRLRHRVFKDQLGWPIPVVDLLEIDEFDPMAWHCAVFHQGRMAGYLRALRCDGPTLVASHFDQLTRGRLPRDAETFEISRFAVHPDAPRSVGPALVREGMAMTRDLEARNLIAVTEPAFERFLRNCGLDLARLCEPRPVGHGRRGAVSAMVISCALTEQNLAAVGLVAAA